MLQMYFPNSFFYFSFSIRYHVFRFGVGKKQMQSTCLEELHYVFEELRKSKGKPYNILVRMAEKLTLQGFCFSKVVYIHVLFTSLMVLF